MKRPFIFIVSVLLTLALPDATPAEVAGECVNCHTMHNSQGGVPMATYGGGSGVNPCLTRASCIGCHAYNTSGTENVVNIGSSLVPQVWHNAATDLAGGNFRYIAGADDDNGHNVAAIDPEGNPSMFPPPGDEHSTGIAQTGATALTCAGKYGCHGDPAITGEVESLKGAHHADDSTIDGNSVGTSYRFLKGVLGLENPTTAWRNVNATDHNEYKGAAGQGASSRSSPANSTISGFCAECHGYYHGPGATETGGASPWVRHPSDYSLPSSGDYTSYTTYNIVTPLARVTLPGTPSGTVDPMGTSDDIVMCLSCHKAHAASNYKGLNWDYKNTTLSTAISGCVACHTSKN